MTNNLPAKKDVFSMVSSDSFKKQVAMALPRHIPADKMVRVFLTTLRQNPKLMACSPESLMGSLMEACSLGLMVDGMTGQAYLVPYGKTATLIPGYRGLIMLAHRSGDVSDLYAHVIYENDEYDYQLGTEPFLKHKPCLTDRGAMIAAYAVVHYKHGGADLEIMGAEDIEKVRDSSKAKNNGPWVTHPAEMWRKTAIRRLVKRVPIDSEKFESAVRKETAYEAGEIEVLDESIIEIEMPTEEKVGSVLSEKVADKESSAEDEADKKLFK